MKLNYRIYEEYSGEMPEGNTQFTEQMIIAQVKQEYAQPKRIVIRPKESVWKSVLMLLMFLTTIIVGLVSLRIFTGISVLIFAILCVLCILAYILIFFKKILVTAIILYQKYAPEAVRSNCLYKPCCSEYMKISVKNTELSKASSKGSNVYHAAVIQTAVQTNHKEKCLCSTKQSQSSTTKNEKRQRSYAQQRV